MSVENIYNSKGNVIGGKYTPPPPPKINSKTATNGLQPDIDDLDLVGRLEGFYHAANTHGLNSEYRNILAKNQAAQILEALYHRLAAEAVRYEVGTVWSDKHNRFVQGVVPAIPLDKLKAIMEIKE